VRRLQQQFCHLGDRARGVVEGLLVGADLAEGDFHLLLDWLDKVRVGLWLSKYILEENRLGITPNFYIAQRFRAFDRGVIVIRHTGKKSSVSITGTFLPSFVISPTAFALVINSVVLINLTEMDLCSRRLGFPFLKKVALLPTGPIKAEVRPGIKRCMQPILKNFRQRNRAGSISQSTQR
jgi:hypothetical protein